MESLHDNKLLRFHPDTMETLRKMYNLHGTGDMDNAIDVLEDWLKKQHHLTKKEYPRAYLERSIILQKGSLERTKAHINKMCALRTLLPEFFTKDDPRNGLKKLDGMMCAGLVPTLTEDHYRVVLLKFSCNNISAQIFYEIYKLIIVLAEYMRVNEYCNGFIIVLDYRDVNIFDYIAAINFTQLHQMIKVIVEGHALRLKGIHLITPSKGLETFLNVVRKMIGAKIGSRLHVHSTIEKLYEHVPQDILPSDFGGNSKSLACLYDDCKTELTTDYYVEYYRELSQATSTQAHGMKDTLSDLDLGLAGSFRSLNVD